VKTLFVGIIAAILLPSAKPASALAPNEILVVVNSRVAVSRELAAHYMKLRGVPQSNLVKVRATTAEDIRRREYEADIAAPVRARLQALEPKTPIRCLLLIFGLPLRILPPEPAPNEIKGLESLGLKKKTALAEIARLSANGASVPEDLKKQIAELDAEAARLRKSDQGASLDSELGLVLADPYPLSGWVGNPRFIGTLRALRDIENVQTMMVSRLDGPDPKTVRRMMDESVSTERAGLTGTAYFDPRWKDSADSPKDAYGFYDRSIHRAAALVKQDGRLRVAVDDSEGLFQPGQCPEAALYCGWYSLGRYIDAFSWKPGAVGFHIASSECTSLKTPGSTEWCQRMLEKGAAATIGPVDEPYVQGFPVPEIFFGLLIKGRLTLAECYAASTPVISWRMVLIGDPLYRPFARSLPRDSPPLAGGARGGGNIHAAPFP
jgi:uncharacterized protein (TIGR03790 family)